MKNRFTSLVLVLIMTFCIIGKPVFAADDAGISVKEYTLNDMEVIIKGIEAPESSDYLTVVVIGQEVTESLLPGEAEYRYVGTIKRLASGNFEDININLNYEKSEKPRKYAISVHLDSMEASEPKTIELTYCNPAMLNKMIADAVEYKPETTDKTGQNAVAYMAGSADSQVFEDSGVWISEYNAMEQGAKDAVDSAVEKVYSDLTYKTLNEIVNGSIIAGTMANDEVDEVLNKLKKYEEELFDPEDESTWVFGIKGKENENGSIPMIAFKHLDEDTQRWVAKTVKNNARTTNMTTYEEMQKAVKQAMLLSMVNTENYSYIEKLLTENMDILDGDWSAFTSLKSQESKNAVMRDIKVDNNESIEYKTVEELLNAVNTAIADLSKDKGNSGNSGNGGGAGGGGNKGGSFPTVDRGMQITGTTQASKGKFVDMSGFGWAVEAVESLHNKGILNGVGEGRFEPGRAITREEFVKLICEAFGFGKSAANVPFKDVSSNGWYAPYISKAYELGIINGMSENSFGIGATLTREDMAVITCRAIEYAGVALNYTENNFVDANMINDYAANSVNALANAGIVNGVGDGRFMPKNNASRAEVAVILYRCLNEFKIN